jgi:DNA-binding transcriptional MerR regulator
MAANKDTGGPPPGRTIDELARDFQLPVSTLRMYQHRGLLPSPERRGRVAYYSDGHADRLRMLVALQERGFSLAAIKELLDSWQEGRSLDDVLGMAVAGSVWEREEPLVLDPAELVARFPAGGVTPELFLRAAELGITNLTEDGKVELPMPRYLDIGTRLVELGIPAGEVIDEYAFLRQTCDVLADRFTDIFRRHIWQAMVDDEDGAGVPAPERVDEIGRSLAELGPLALGIVESTLRHAIQDAARRFLDEQAGVLAAPAPAPRAKKSAKVR